MHGVSLCTTSRPHRPGLSARTAGGQAGFVSGWIGVALNTELLRVGASLKNTAALLASKLAAQGAARTRGATGAGEHATPFRAR
jgi:hypothetical protein